MEDKYFILSDESLNSHGLIIETNGIILERFLKNPVMGIDHKTESVRDIVGRWDDTHVSGSFLKALPAFDMGVSDGESTAGQVERGFIRAASITVDVLEVAIPEDKSLPMRVTKCLLVEASIVSIPSNENAIKLNYNDKELLLNDDTSKDKLRLFLSKQNKSNMKKEELDKLNESLTEKDSTIEELKASKIELKMNITNLTKNVEDLDKSEKELKLSLAEKDSTIEELKLSIDGLTEDKKRSYFKSAVDAGKVTVELEDEYLELKFDKMKSMLDKLSPANASLREALKLNKEKSNQADKSKSFEWYMSNDLNGFRNLPEDEQKRLEDINYNNKK